MTATTITAPLTDAPTVNHKHPDRIRISLNHHGHPGKVALLADGSIIRTWRLGGYGRLRPGPPAWVRAAVAEVLAAAS